MAAEPEPRLGAAAYMSHELISSEKNLAEKARIELGPRGCEPNSLTTRPSWLYFADYCANIKAIGKIILVLFIFTQ